MTPKYIIAAYDPKEYTSLQIRTCIDENDMLGWLKVLGIDDMTINSTLIRMKKGESGKFRVMCSYDSTYIVRVVRFDSCIRSMNEIYSSIAPKNPFYEGNENKA